MRRRRDLLPLMVLAGLASTCAAVTPPEPIKLPELNLDLLGDIQLLGNFSDISLLDYNGRETMLQTPTPREDRIYQTGNDTYVSSSFADGAISASCMLSDNRSAIIAGNFSSVLNVTVNGIAKVDLLNGTATSLGAQAPQGPINALWCNGSEVFAGGSFKFGSSYGVAVWNSINATWTSPLFGGFVNGSEVNAIVPVRDNLVFGGTLKGLASAKSGNSSQQNRTELLSPGMQPVTFNFANATGFGASESSGSPASDLLCPYTADSATTGWMADLDSTSGYVNVTLDSQGVLPTRMRLFNLPDGNGTKTFRLVTSPANGIMNLSYVDAAGDVQYCGAYCPLPEKNTSVDYQDFELVNVVPTSSLRIELLDYYGNHAGLKGIQLFQEGQYAYANEAFNMPRNCGATGFNGDLQGSQTAKATLRGDWTAVSDYMSANITDKASFRSTSADLIPAFTDYAVDRGQYAIQLWTPGCQQDGTCSQRGQVNVSVYPGFGSTQSTVLYQTNNFAKYDVVYNGTLQDGAYIRISPTTQNQLPMQLVAYKANLIYVGPPQDENVSVVFEYSPANFSSNSSRPVGKTALNSLGEKLGANAIVNALLVNGSTNLLIGGSGFSSNVSTSLLTCPLSSTEVGNLSSTNITEDVLKLYSLDGGPYALSSNQTYRLRRTSAHSLGIGKSTAAARFELNGTSYVVFSHENASSQLSLWDPKREKFPPQVMGKVQGHLEETYEIGNTTLYLGSLEIVDAATSGGGVLIGASDPRELVNLPFSFSALNASQSSLRSVAHKKRSEDQQSAVRSEGDAIYAGTYVNSTHSIVAGHFNATVNNNQSAVNALIMTREYAEPLPLASGDSIDSQSSFYAAASINSTVALGGNVTGKISGGDIRGLVLYNVSAQQPFATQAPALYERGVISALVFKPNSSELIVGGDFSADKAKLNSSCNGLCGYDTRTREWFAFRSLDLGASAVVTDLVFETGDRLVIAGNFTIGNDNSVSHVAVYDFGNNTLEPIGQLPGPVTSIVVLSNATQDPMYAVSGLVTTNGRASSYLQWYNGTSREWHAFENIELTSESQVSKLSLVTLQNQTRGTAPLSGNQGLLISGKLQLPNNVRASVAVYDGAQLQGLYATTSDWSSDEATGGQGDNTGLVNAIYSQYGGNLKGGVLFNEGTSRPHPRPAPSPKPTGGNTSGGQHFMPTGHVVGVACGIGVGCVMLLTLLYFLIELLFRLGSSRIAYQNLAQAKPATDPMAGTKVL